MQLVFLALEVIEKSAYAEELTFAFNNHATLLGVKISPGDVERDARLLCEALQLGKQGSILGLGPGIDGAFVQRLRFVGNDQVEIEVDGVAKTLAARAGAVRIVERKQARFGLLVAQVAMFALEALRETRSLRRLVVVRGSLEDDLAGLAIADFDGIYNAGAGVTAYEM